MVHAKKNAAKFTALRKSMKLLGTPGSPYARKVRIVLAEKRVAYEYIIDRPSSPATRVAQFNPLGKIPVLVCDDGRAAYDSAVLGELLFTRRLACGKGLGNAAAIRRNQAQLRRDELYQTSPLGCAHLTIDECDCGCNKD